MTDSQINRDQDYENDMFEDTVDISPHSDPQTNIRSDNEPQVGALLYRSPGISEVTDKTWDRTAWLGSVVSVCLWLGSVVCVHRQRIMSFS